MVASVDFSAFGLVLLVSGQYKMTAQDLARARFGGGEGLGTVNVRRIAWPCIRVLISNSPQQTLTNVSLVDFVVSRVYLVQLTMFVLLHILRHNPWPFFPNFHGISVGTLVSAPHLFRTSFSYPFFYYLPPDRLFPLPWLKPATLLTLMPRFGPKRPGHCQH